MKMMAEAPRSPAPTKKRGTSMKLAPRKAATAPDAVATEFIVTTCSRGTTWGSDADSPDVDEPGQAVGEQRSEQQRHVAGPDGQDRADRGDQISAGPMLAPTSTSRRSQRSISAPANGPSSE